MFYIGKLFQAAGLTVIMIDFLLRFPRLMNPRVLLLGATFFTIGWIINKYLVKQ